ncbi:MAG: cation transporter [Coprothermobacterota bacterium]|nr:cation transporter [Coprothermobacterota bacterium]
MNQTDLLATSHKRRIAAYSVGVGIILTTLKLVLGLLTSSLGILSEALRSFLDLGAALITFFSIRISTRPPGVGATQSPPLLARGSLIACGSVFWQDGEHLYPRQIFSPRCRLHHTR